MYQILTFFHSLFRWLVLISLCVAIYKAFKGYILKSAFTKTDNAIRHWTATIAHIQLVTGILFYVKSPVIKYFWKSFQEASKTLDTLFFGLIHIAMMLAAIVMITIGSALAKRRAASSDQFKTMLYWFSAALIIIFIAIPWPFSPFAHRPYLR